MSTTQQNLAHLAVLCRDHKRAFAAVCATARKLNLANPKRKAPTQSAATTRLQNYVRGIHPQDLQNAIAKHGTTSVFNQVQTASILETAAQKFAEQAIRKAGK